MITTENTESTEKKLVECPEGLIEIVIGAALRVHRTFGPGLLESVYERALAFELMDQGVAARIQIEIPVSYRGRPLGLGFRADMIVESSLLLEIKAVENVVDIH
ncbi:MAG: GxxExxY protein, partial [Rhodocyclaceae bacterium]|nr:GxxExxY protein [Rhodocyclaceae bacterium]